MLGVPVSAVDYDGALDWMDGTVAARGSGYVCVAATHTVMVAQEDPETMDAVLGASLVVPDGQPLVWALRALGRPLPDRVYGPDLMLRYCERAAEHGHPDLPVRRAQPGRARPAHAEPPPALPRPAGRRRLLAAVPRPRRRRAGHDRRRDQPHRRGRRVGRDRRAEAGEVDGRHARAPRRARPGGRRRRVRLPRRASCPRPRAGCSRRAWSGRSASRRSRGGCGGATCATTRASSRGSSRSWRAAVVRAPTTASLPDVSIDVSVIGIGRIGLPLALSFADRGLNVLGVDNDPERLAAVAEGRMPFDEPGAQEVLDRVHASGRLELSDSRRRRRTRREHRHHARDAVVLAHRDRHPRHPLGARRPAGAPAPGPDDRAALDRRARHDRLRRRLHRQAPRPAGRRGRVRRPRPRAHRGRALLRGDRHAAVHRRRRRRARRASAPRSCSRRSPRRSRRRRPSRPSWRRSGPTSCATRRSRCPTS